MEITEEILFDLFDQINGQLEKYYSDKNSVQRLRVCKITVRNEKNIICALHIENNL